MVKIGVTVYLKVNYQKKKLNPKKKWRERERERAMFKVYSRALSISLFSHIY